MLHIPGIMISANFVLEYTDLLWFDHLLKIKYQAHKLYVYVDLLVYMHRQTVRWMSGRTDRQMYIQISIYSKSLWLLRSDVQRNMGLLLCLVLGVFTFFLIFRFLIWLHHAIVCICDMIRDILYHPLPNYLHFVYHWNFCFMSHSW